jgi:hypothetical protein
MSRRIGGISHVEDQFALQLKECDGNVGAAQGVLASKLGNKIEIPLSLRNEITWELGIQDNAGADEVSSYWGQSKINLLDTQTPNTAQGMVNVSNDFASGSQLGCDFLMFGVGFELVGENMSFALRGNAINSDGTVFVSPDDFLSEDVTAIGAPNTDHLEAGITPAVLDFGGCTQRAAEAISDGYALTMLVQQTFPLIGGGPHARPLSDFASCGNPEGYAKGMSSSQVDSAFWVNEANDHYSNLSAGNPFGRRFVPTNVSRQGEQLASTTAHPGSAFSPDSSSDLVDATWGVDSQHPLYTNECWKPFLTPVLIRQGAPFQVYLEEYDQAFAARAKAMLGTTFAGNQAIDTTGAAAAVGFGGVGTAGTFTEVNTGAAADVIGLSTNSQCVVYKYGLLRMRVCFYGYQIVDPDVTTLLMGVGGAPSAKGHVAGFEHGTKQSLLVLGPNQ